MAEQHLGGFTDQGRVDVEQAIAEARVRPGVPIEGHVVAPRQAKDWTPLVVSQTA